MKIIDLLKDIDYELIKGNLFDDIIDIAYDTRKVIPGSLFVAITGTQVDGHSFINDAIIKGANTIIVEKDILVDANVNIIKINNTRKGLSQLSANFFGHPENKLTTIAITGTKGKTTTSWMIKSILEKDNKKVGVIGTNGVFYTDKHIKINNTTPESYDVFKYMNDMVNNGVEYLVIEVSSQALMLNRVYSICFDYGIFTNLSLDHIGDNEHKDFDDYKYCKSLLFKQCKMGIFNIDDENANYMIKNATCKVSTIGMLDNFDLDLQVISTNLFRENGTLGIILKTKGLINDSFKVSVPGNFSAYNSLCAIMVCHLLKVSDSVIKEALANFKVRGRVEPVEISDKFTILIDYAHNGMSMESILTTMREYHPRRLITVFGCGGNRSKTRRYEMGEISGKYADLSIITADNSRYEEVEDIINDILIGVKKTTGSYVSIADRKQAIKYSIQNAQEGDIILVLGKGQEDYQEIKGVKYPFDERIIINEIAKDLNLKRD